MRRCVTCTSSQPTGLYSNVVGGVKVVVRAEDVDEAFDILDNVPLIEDIEDPPTVEENTSDVTSCPRCGGAMTVSTTLTKRLAALSWLVAGVPVLSVNQRPRCDSCGFRLP